MPAGEVGHVEAAMPAGEVGHVGAAMPACLMGGASRVVPCAWRGAHPPHRQPFVISTLLVVTIVILYED